MAYWYHHSHGQGKLYIVSCAHFTGKAFLDCPSRAKHFTIISPQVALRLCRSANGDKYREDRISRKINWLAMQHYRVSSTSFIQYQIKTRIEIDIEWRRFNIKYSLLFHSHLRQMTMRMWCFVIKESNCKDLLAVEKIDIIWLWEIFIISYHLY